jgi:hypothetical protein
MRADLRAIALAGLAVLTIAAPVSGQGLRFEISGVYATLNGDDFETTKGGVGFEGALVLGLNSKWSLAAGATRTSHDEEDIDLSTSVLQIFAEPRFMLSSSGSVAPYLFGRVGWINAKADDIDAKATGFAFGGGLGMLLKISGAVSLNAAAGFHKVSLGDAEIAGETIPESDASGTSILFRGGISIGFGGSSALKTLPVRTGAR